MKSDFFYLSERNQQFYIEFTFFTTNVFCFQVREQVDALQGGYFLVPPEKLDGSNNL